LAVGLAAGIAYAHTNQFYGMGGYHMPGDGSYMMQGMMPHGVTYNGGCPGYGGYAMGIGGSQQQFLDATAALRREMHEKQFELLEAARNPQITTAQLTELRKEIVDLQAKIHEQASAVQTPQ
jgi:hypothetical protein